MPPDSGLAIVPLPGACAGVYSDFGVWPFAQMQRSARDHAAVKRTIDDAQARRSRARGIERRIVTMARRDRWSAGLVGTGLALVMAATVFAYAGEVAGAVSVAPPSGTLACGTPLTVSATVLDAASSPIDGQPVDWTFTSSVTGDTINTTPTTTNASGVATTTVTLACVVGDRIVTATADAISANAVLGITSAGLPRTSTVPDGSPFGNLPIATLFALLAMLVGGGIILRRFAFRPR